MQAAWNNFRSQARLPAHPRRFLHRARAAGSCLTSGEITVAVPNGKKEKKRERKEREKREKREKRERKKREKEKKERKRKEEEEEKEEEREGKGRDH